MSSIANIHVTNFNRTLLRTVETKGGKMRPVTKLATGDLYREKGVYPRITGGGRVSQKMVRGGPSPVSQQVYSNRSVKRLDFNDGFYFDDITDLKRSIADPRGESMDIMTQKFFREEDLRIQEAMLGIAQGGDLGDTPVPFDTDNILGVGLGAASGASTAGFTYEKITELIEQMLNNNVLLNEEYRPQIYISGRQLHDMLEQDKFINKDYINDQISKGWKIPNYMGCDFHCTNILPYMNTAGTGFSIDLTDDVDSDGVWEDSDTTKTRAIIATVKNSTQLEFNPNIRTKMDELPEKSFVIYAYAEFSLGAVRMEEEKVFAIPCDENL